MKIHSESRIHYPREKVFSVYRDRLPELVGYLPDIRTIRVKSRKEGDVVEIHNEWEGDKEIPKVAQSILKPEHLVWDDYAAWDPSTYKCKWEIKTRVFTEAVSCSGYNTFLEDGEGTRVVLTGDLTISLKSVPGVPGFIGRRLAPQLEKFIVALITPNLERVNASLEQFLDDQG